MRGLATELARLGATRDGIAWVLSALDPAHAYSVVDAPTHDAAPVALPQYVQELTIDPPSAYGQSWDCCIVTYGGDNTHCVWAIGPQNTDFSTYGMSGFVAQGTFSAVQAAPTTVEFPLVIGTGPDPKQFQTSQLARDIGMGRSTSRSITIDYTGPQLENGGTVVCAHFCSLGGNSHDPVLRLTNNGVLAACTSPVISLRESDFPTVNTLFFAGPAREGVYLPQRVTPNPYAQVFVANGQTVPIKGEGMYLANGYPISSVFLATDPNATNSPWSMPGVPPLLSLAIPSGDCFIDSTPPTVTIFRGLQPGASLLVKGVLSLAISPQPTSNERPYVRPPALEDPIAIEAYNRILGSLPAAWPSSYNFLGALGGILAAIGRTVLPMIMPVARAAGVSMVTAAADEATRRIVKATEHRQERAPGTAKAVKARPPPLPRAATARLLPSPPSIQKRAKTAPQRTLSRKPAKKPAPKQAKRR